MVSANSESTKPALPYSDTIVVSTDHETIKPAFPCLTNLENLIDSDTMQSIQANQSQHSGGGRAGSIDTFIDGKHSISAKPAPTQTLNRKGIPEILRGFKTFSARRINENRRAQGTPVWQRNYYEHTDRLYPDNSSNW